MSEETQRIEAMRARYQALRTTAEWRVFTYRCKEAAGFKCAMCETRGEKKLETHHWWYDWARMPWDVEVGQVCVMCSECHEKMHDGWETLKAIVRGRCGRLVAGEFLKTFRRHVLAGFTPERLRALNAQLTIGGADGPLVGQAAAFLANRQVLPSQSMRVNAQLQLSSSDRGAGDPPK